MVACSLLRILVVCIEYEVRILPTISHQTIKKRDITQFVKGQTEQSSRSDVSIRTTRQSGLGAGAVILNAAMQPDIKNGNTVMHGWIVGDGDGDGNLGRPETLSLLRAPRQRISDHVT